MGVFDRIGKPNQDPRHTVREGGTTGVYLAAEHLVGVARALVPKDEGTLERSGAAATDGLQGVVSFDTPYAVIQHEALDFHHPRGGQAKYLEQPMGTERDTIKAIIAQAIRKRLEGG